MKQRAALGRVLRHRANLYRRVPVWRRAGVVFIHVPKAGGTSISRALYGRNTGHYSVAELDFWTPGFTRSLPRFAVARNPYDRVVSAWRFAVHGGGDGMGMQGTDHLELATHSLEWFCTEWLGEKPLASRDFVFRTQSSFICTKGVLAVDHLGHVEDLAPTVSWLSATLGSDVQFQRLNRSSETTSPATDGLSREARGVIEELYRDDFDLLGYSRSN